MRFRTPELFLGAFLTVAVFSTGVLFSSQYPGTTTQPNSTEKADKPAGEKGDPKGFWQTATTDPVATFTLALVLVGMFQAGFFFIQLRLMRDGVDDAKLAALAAQRAAKATEIAVELSRQTAEWQLRAYLLVSKGIIGVVSTGNSIINITVRNFGQTPAKDVTIWVDMRFGSDSDSEFVGTKNPTVSPTILGPGGKYTTTFYKKDITPAQKDGLFNSHNVAIHVFGEIRYVDVFGCNRKTKLRLIQRGGSEFRDKPMAFAQDGNKAT
jgi:hypothetical protein